MVVNSRFLKPLDEGMLLDLASSFGEIFTVEEGVLSCGFGAAVLEFYQSKKIFPKVHCLGLPEEFISQGENPALLEKYHLNAEGIADQISKIL